MHILTFKAKPKTIFGLIIALTGVVVILITFIGNHSGAAQKAAQVSVSCKTTDERESYLHSLGWSTDGNESEKNITVPKEFNDVYNQYNEIQKKQGFDLESFKGQEATVYTYKITNYNKSESVVVDLIVANGVLIGADLCDVSADNGFLTVLEENKSDG